MKRIISFKFLNFVYKDLFLDMCIIMFCIVCLNKKKLLENYKWVILFKIIIDVKKELSFCLFDMSKNK